MCEQQGTEPHPEKMPLSTSDFPYEVQVAFFIYSLLPDRWDGMSGYYMGKDWSSLGTVFSIYQVEDQKEVFYFMKIYETKIVNYRAKQAEQKRKAEERKRQTAGGGTKYAHNVKG